MTDLRSQELNLIFLLDRLPTSLELLAQLASLEDLLIFIGNLAPFVRTYGYRRPVRQRAAIWCSFTYPNRKFHDN